MRRPAENAAVALFDAVAGRARSTLAAGAPFSAVASFPLHPHLGPMSLLLVSYGSQPFAGMVWVEPLVNPGEDTVLKSGIRFEMHAGRTHLGMGTIVIARQREHPSDRVDKVAEPAWRGGIERTLWAA